MYPKICLEFVEYVCNQVIQQCGCDEQHCVDCNYVEAKHLLSQIEKIGDSELVSVWRTNNEKIY